MRRGLSLLEVLIIVAILVILAAIAIPNMQGARKYGNEAAAIGALKTIAAAQATFQQRKLAGGRFGDLRELAEEGLLEEPLASGARQGYAFETGPSLREPGLLWFATARPVVPRVTGDRYFAVTQAGVVFYTVGAPIVVPAGSCQVPASALPVGR